MNQDILFKTDDFVFSYRVAEVLTLNNSKEIKHFIYREEV